jgi:hypothetical protein
MDKRGMVVKSKNRRRTGQRFLKFSTACATFNICKLERSASEKRDGN